MGKDKVCCYPLLFCSITEAYAYLQDIVSYPITRGKTINVAAFVNTPGAEGTTYPGLWVTESTPAEVLKNFTGWDSSVKDLLQVPLCRNTLP